jgi:hypothetical protein
MNCPACGGDMRSMSLLSRYSVKPYRVCPECNAKYTAEPETRRRQVPLFFLVLVALGLTFAASLRGMAWLLPAVASHVVPWACIGYTLSKVAYVRYPE